jgi:pimeloyl-ACP methyl ester carboxylesterase
MADASLQLIRIYMHMLTAANETESPSSKLGVDPAVACSPPAAHSFFVDVDGGRIACDDTGGDGPLIIAIPGMGDVRAEYRYLSPLLIAAGYRVVTMDIRGHGDSSARWDDYSARAVGSDALAVARHLGRTEVFLFGNSFAAGSALWAAREAPEHVRGVVLLGPIVRDGPPSVVTRLALTLGFGGPWRVWFWLTYWNSLFPLAKPPDHARYRRALGKALRGPGRMEALRIMVGLSKAETESIVDTVKVPALVVMGRRDPDFRDARDEAAWLAGKLGCASLIIEGAGHYPHVEAPGQVADALADFLDGLRPGAR